MKNRIKVFKDITKVYNKDYIENENMTACLGEIDSAGFMVLLGILLVSGTKKEPFTSSPHIIPAQ